MKSDNFILINLEGGESFVFMFFPTDVQTTRRANWEPQDTTLGTKPIFYGNRDPKRISVPEVWLDQADTNESIAPDIVALFDLQKESKQHGRPPALLAAWGDRQERCVLEEVTVSEKFFSPEGIPLRASVSLQLLELQQEREMVTSTVRDVETTAGDSGSGIGNF